MVTAASRAAADDTRERILAAALETFAEKGFDGATTRAIAARAGVNLGLINYHFDGKLKLWRAAVDRAFENLREAVGGPAAPLLANPERIREGIRRYVRFVARNPEFVRLMHDEGKRPGPRMRWLVDRHVRPFYDGMSAMLREAQGRGMLPAHLAPLHFHYILVGAVAMIFHQAEECRRLAGVDPADDAVIEAHAEAVAYLLLGPQESA